MASEGKKRILLHICCATCGAGTIERLKGLGFEDILLFEFNPNIFPPEEHEKRACDIRALSLKKGLRLIEMPYDHDAWSFHASPLALEPEGGKRCEMCFALRLEGAAKKAAELGIFYFTSTLSVSPHKDFKKILHIGEAVGKAYGVEFLPEDFKKKGGFQACAALSKELGFYRQRYCGCEFSMRPADDREKEPGR